MTMNITLIERLMRGFSRRPTTSRNMNHNGALLEYSLKVKREGLRRCAARNSEPNDGDGMMMSNHPSRRCGILR
jgi:hypothetical protein